MSLLDFWHDVRYAVRRLVEARWLTLAAVTALSLGIGANTTVFTFVNAILLRGLPFQDSDRLVSVWMRNEQGERMAAVSLPDLRDMRDESSTLQEMAGFLGSGDRPAVRRLRRRPGRGARRVAGLRRLAERLRRRPRRAGTHGPCEQSTRERGGGHGVRDAFPGQQRSPAWFRRRERRGSTR